MCELYLGMKFIIFFTSDRASYTVIWTLEGRNSWSREVRDALQAWKFDTLSCEPCFRNYESSRHKKEHSPKGRVLLQIPLQEKVVNLCTWRRRLLQHSLTYLSAVRSTQGNGHGYEYDLTYACLSAKQEYFPQALMYTLASPSCTPCGRMMRT